MKRRPREINTFSLSAIDLFACATGAFLLLAVILLQYRSKEEPTPPAIVQPTPMPTPVPTPTPSEIPEGFQIEVPLGIDVEWKDRGVDLDLHVVHNGEVVFFGNPATRWGILTKDETKSVREVNREVFFAPRFDQGITEGNYKVYLAYYGGRGSGPYEVSGKLVVFPGRTAEASYPFKVSVQTVHRGAPQVTTPPSPVALEFDISLPPGASGEDEEDFQVQVR